MGAPFKQVKVKSASQIIYAGFMYRVGLEIHNHIAPASEEYFDILGNTITVFETHSREMRRAIPRQKTLELV